MDDFFASPWLYSQIHKIKPEKYVLDENNTNGNFKEVTKINAQRNVVRQLFNEFKTQDLLSDSLPQRKILAVKNTNIKSQLEKRKEIMEEKKVNFKKLSKNFEQLENLKKLNPNFGLIRIKLERVCDVDIAEEHRKSIKSFKAQLKQERWELKIILDAFFENFEPILVVTISLITKIDVQQGQQEAIHLI